MARNSKPAPPAGKTVTQADAYRKAIDIVAQGYDPAKIATELAKRNPELFVTLYVETSVAPPEKWMRDVIGMVVRGEKVPAIKTLREHCNLGLKEAKDIIDYLPPRMHSIGYPLSTVPNPSTATLPAALMPIYERLVMAAQQCK